MHTTTLQSDSNSNYVFSTKIRDLEYSGFYRPLNQNNNYGALSFRIVFMKEQIGKAGKTVTALIFFFCETQLYNFHYLFRKILVFLTGSSDWSEPQTFLTDSWQHVLLGFIEPTVVILISSAIKITSVTLLRCMTSNLALCGCWSLDSILVMWHAVAQKSIITT